MWQSLGCARISETPRGRLQIFKQEILEAFYLAKHIADFPVSQNVCFNIILSVMIFGHRRDLKRVMKKVYTLRATLLEKEKGKICWGRMVFKGWCLKVSCSQLLSLHLKHFF